MLKRLILAGAVALALAGCGATAAQKAVSFSSGYTVTARSLTVALDAGAIPAAAKPAIRAADDAAYAADVKVLRALQDCPRDATGTIAPSCSESGVMQGMKAAALTAVGKLASLLATYGVKSP